MKVNLRASCKFAFVDYVKLFEPVIAHVMPSEALSGGDSGHCGGLE